MRPLFLILAALLLAPAAPSCAANAETASLFLSGSKLRRELRLSANDLKRLDAELKQTASATKSSRPAIDALNQLRELLVGKSGYGGLHGELVKADRELEGGLRDIQKFPDSCAGAKLNDWAAGVQAERRLLKTLSRLKELHAATLKIKGAAANLRTISYKVPGNNARQSLGAYAARHQSGMDAVGQRLYQGLRAKEFSSLGRMALNRQSACAEAPPEPAPLEGTAAAADGKATAAKQRDYSKGEKALQEALGKQIEKYPTGKNLWNSLTVKPHVRIEDFNANAKYTDKETWSKDVLGDKDEVVFSADLIKGKIAYFDKDAAAGLKSAQDVRKYLDDNPDMVQSIADNIDSTFVHELTHGTQFQSFEGMKDASFFVLTADADGNQSWKYPVAAEWDAFDMKWRYIHDKVQDDPALLKSPGASRGEITSESSGYLAYLQDQDQERDDVAALYGNKVLASDSEHMPKDIKKFYDERDAAAEKWWDTNEEAGYQTACQHYDKKYCSRVPEFGCQQYKDLCGRVDPAIACKYHKDLCPKPDDDNVTRPEPKPDPKPDPKPEPEPQKGWQGFFGKIKGWFGR
ncbi:MAG: hypothetical protein ABIJ96_08220 [Elusimicrobiota bacterium]